MKTNRKAATGTEGCIIHVGDGVYCFRVYDKDFGFTDYELVHSDLFVKIVDHDADFVTHENGRCTLDHSKSTLGLK